MIYFIFWALLILTIALSVPVVNAIEKKKRLAAMAPQDTGEAGDDEFAGDADADAGFGEAVEEEAAEVVSEAEEAVDDFGAFEEEFK